LGKCGQINKDDFHFKTAKKNTSHQQRAKLHITAINAVVMADDNIQTKAIILNMWANFWEFISGIKTLYTEIIDPLWS